MLTVISGCPIYGLECSLSGAGIPREIDRIAVRSIEAANFEQAGIHGLDGPVLWDPVPVRAGLTAQPRGLIISIDTSWRKGCRFGDRVPGFRVIKGSAKDGGWAACGVRPGRTHLIK